MLDKYQLQEQWGIVDRIARIPNECRKNADWNELGKALETLGYRLEGHIALCEVAYTARRKHHWIVIISRPRREGFRAGGRGLTIDKAWRAAVRNAYGAIWLCEDSEHGVVTPWIVWQGLYQEAQQQIRAIRGSQRKYAIATYHGCSVEIERVS